MAAPVPTRRPDGRSERRIPKRLAAELSRPGESVPKEMTFTENASPRGVRVTAVQQLATWNSRAGYFSSEWHSVSRKDRLLPARESGTFALELEVPWQVQALADAADVRFGVP